MPEEQQGDDMKPLPKPKATHHPVLGCWVVHLPGTFTHHGWTLKQAYLAWVHANWTRSRIMRTV
jgi:hypothetical protein